MALSGKVAIVTGAGQGLGKGISDILLKNGAKVVLLDRNETAGKSARADCAKKYGGDCVIFCPCDVTSDEHMKDAFQKTIEKFGRIDIVCNNAGIVDETNWEKMVEINLSGVVRGTYLALQYMKKENGGSGGVVVNTASIAGMEPFLLLPVYTATKHGVIGFTRAMADASKASGYGVRLNAVCPTLINTPLMECMTIDSLTGQLSHLAPYCLEFQEKLGMLEVPVVAEAVLQLVADEEKNGAAIMVTKHGTTCADFPQLLKDLPKTARP
ncbi:hypothetical protein GJAV_G00135520 [Gymnothorax javanicus]|nr:hypothetical protein GJAV_G00135520 [Gymnothorax javanicus]